MRAGRFIARKNWIVVGSDDFHVRVFNYNTGEKVVQFEAHPDYIRTIAVHPTQPFVITAGDDMTIKLWNWDQNWRNQQTFEGHVNYIMSLAFNPKDPNTFASACLDRTVKIWSLGSSVPNFTLEAHETKGVNYVDYFPSSDKPYLITASDDRSIKVWDYQTKSTVATLVDHTNNVSFAIVHPELPVIISGSEDNTIKIWNANTYKLEQTLNYGLKRAWCAAVRKGSNVAALGFDEGYLLVQLGKEEPAISMDPSGKLVWSKHSEVYSSVIKSSAEREIKDGEQLHLQQKDLGTVEVFPTSLVHSPNGRFVTVVGDGEYIIYTALAWRNKSFGSALDFAWAQDSNEYAVRESPSSVKAFKNFKERPLSHFNIPFSTTQIFGGALLGVNGDGFIAFYDWNTGAVVQRVDVDARQVVWSAGGDLVAIISENTFYTLRFNHEALEEALSSGNTGSLEDGGIDGTFALEEEISDSVRTGQWVGDCFVYTTLSNRLNYLVGSDTYTITHFDKQMYLLGYIARDNAIYLADKDVNVSAYRLSLAVVEYQTVVLRGDMETAAEILERDIADAEKNKIARFLEAQGHKELALEVSKDAEHRFDLALALGQLEIAHDIAVEANDETKWKNLGDRALSEWQVGLAERCFTQGNDIESLLLIYTSTGNKKALKDVVVPKALEAGKNNIAFNALWFVGDIDGCVDILNSTHRSSEAALLALTYGGDVGASVKLWKERLTKLGRGKIAETICDPENNPDKFPSNLGQKVTNVPVHAAGENDLIELDGISTPVDRDTPAPTTEADEAEAEVDAPANGKALEGEPEAEPEAEPEVEPEVEADEPADE